MRALFAVLVLSAAAYGQVPLPSPFATGGGGGTIASTTNILSGDGAGSAVSSGIAAADVALVARPFVSGALSLYYFNEGAGSTITDQSGNGRNCTNSGGVWTQGGLEFDQIADYITCPAGTLNGANTVEIWWGPAVAYGPGVTGAKGLLVSNNAASQGIQPNIGPAQAYGGVYVNVGSQEQPDERCGTVCHLAVTTGTGLIYFNGIKTIGLAWSAGAITAWSSTTNSYLGYPGSNSPLVRIYGFATYSGTLTAAQIAQNDAAMRAILAQRGVSITPMTNQAPLLAMVGDSMTTGFGGYPYADAFAAGVPDFQPYSLALAGQTLATINSNESTSVVPLVQHNQSVNLVSMFAGTNDVGNSASAATVSAAEQSFGTTLKNAAPSAKCMVWTILPRSTFSGAQETVRGTVNTNLYGYWAGGTLTCDALVDGAGDPMMGWTGATALSAYYVDGTHPGATGAQILAARAKAAANQLLYPTVPYWLPVNVPYQRFSATAATTLTVDLLQLGPKQQVCGVQQQVTTTFAGTSISALTASIGDSTGTATQYLGTLTLLATGQNTIAGPSYAVVGGKVQASFSATGANLSALTQGNMQVNICIVTQSAQ